MMASPPYPWSIAELCENAGIALQLGGGTVQWLAAWYVEGTPEALQNALRLILGFIHYRWTATAPGERGFPGNLRTRAGTQLGSIPLVPCWQPDSHVPGRVQRERWPDGRAGRRYIAATWPFRKELEENGVYGARVEQDASYVRVLPSIDIATKSGRDWILQKFVREILCDTVMHLVVATPPLPETTGAEFLQILVAQSQVYTEICVCVCVL
eukprot:s4360_g10.t1